MSGTTERAPTREDFAALLNESYGDNEAFEGSVIKGRVVAIEKDVAVIDIGLKTEGRVALKEFTGYGRDPAPQIGEEVEVYLERVENSAVKARDCGWSRRCGCEIQFEGHVRLHNLYVHTIKSI